MALPDLKLRVSQQEVARLAQRLRSLGYQEKAVTELLGLWDLSQLDADELPRYIWRCRQAETDLASLVLLFLLGEGLPRELVTKLLEREVLTALLHCGVLFPKAGALYSQVVLYPCMDHYFFTDYWVTEEQAEGHVYELGTDSFVLARLTPRKGTEKALDLCTGSGIHAVMSAKLCQSAEAVDINPRALEYTKLNAALNSVTCGTHLADLYTPFTDERFDLITANPPYVPSPDSKVLIHRSAGESGDEVPERLVAGLPKHLAPGGLFSMVLEYPVSKRDHYLERLESWLGEKEGWGIAVLSFGEKPVGAYIKRHMGLCEDYHAKFQRYLESYDSQGIESIDFANVFIYREHTKNRNWKLKIRTFWPNVNIAEQVGDWLASQSKFRSPEWRPEPDWKPQLSRHYKTLWRDWDHTQGTLEPHEHNWLLPDTLSSDEAELLSRMRGETTVSELRETWKGLGKDEEAFLEAFRGLGLRLAIS